MKTLLYATHLFPDVIGGKKPAPQKDDGLKGCHLMERS